MHPKPIKAVMLSAFVFPGAGHLYLKKYAPGIVLAGTAVVSLYIIVSRAVERAQEIADRILRGEVQLDFAVIAELVSRQPAGTDTRLLNLAWAVLIISWLVGIADSYRIGRGQANIDEKVS